MRLQHLQLILQYEKEITFNKTDFQKSVANESEIFEIKFGPYLKTIGRENKEAFP